MLTLGSGWTKNALSVTVGNHRFDSDALTANPATSEVRLLFVYEPQAEDHLRVYVSADLLKRLSSYVPFHHLQLVQID